MEAHETETLKSQKCNYQIRTYERIYKSLDYFSNTEIT